MAELLIRFRRPPSMSDSEMRAWISQRARAHRPELALTRIGDSGPEALVLRVRVPSDATEAAEEQLADLLMDMRLLGLRPSFASRPPRPSGPQRHGHPGHKPSGPQRHGHPGHKMGRSTDS